MTRIKFVKRTEKYRRKNKKNAAFLNIDFTTFRLKIN